MRTLFRLVVMTLLVVPSPTAHAAERLALFGAQLTYANPDPQRWRKDAERRDSAKGLFALKHVGLADREGNTVHPVLVIIYEQLPDPAQSLKEFTRMARERAYFPVEDIIAEEDRIIYFCRFERESSHDLAIAHFLFAGNGVQVMGDAPTSVYDQVQEDIKRFFDSIHFQESGTDQDAH